MQILDGRAVAEARRAGIHARVQDFIRKTEKVPGLAVILVGDDPASQVYVGGKIKACKDVGMESFEVRLPQDTAPSLLKAKINDLNHDPRVHGILVQLPLPAQLNTAEVLSWVSPHKDADCLTMENLGRLWAGRPLTQPCTPSGVIEILKHYRIPLEGAEAVVVGRSEIVGKPMALLLTQANATVTLCHSRTKNLREHLKRADIAVIAAGKPEFLGREDFSSEAVVIDVGIHRCPKAGGKTRLCGDVKFSDVKDHVKAITPVPGGVGPMTITMLLQNTLTLFEASLD